MNIYLILVFAITIAAILIIFGKYRIAGLVAILVAIGCFGYRLSSGDELRAVISDSFFSIALLGIGIFFAKDKITKTM